MNNINVLADCEDVLRPKDLQSILHVGRNTVYRLLEDGSIKSIRIGNKYLVPKLFLLDFIYPERPVAKEA